MKNKNVIKPDFLVIGAQKSGTTWLWSMLNQHPETDLPIEKEIHYFGGIENFRKGKEWYYNHFRNLTNGKLTGEASTTYLYDFMPYLAQFLKAIRIRLHFAFYTGINRP